MKHIPQTVMAMPDRESIYTPYLGTLDPYGYGSNYRTQTWIYLLGPAMSPGMGVCKHQGPLFGIPCNKDHGLVYYVRATLAKDFAGKNPQRTDPYSPSTLTGLQS